MKESYPDDIMLCFVQGFGEGDQRYPKSQELKECNGTVQAESTSSTSNRLSRRRHQKPLKVHIENQETVGRSDGELESLEESTEIEGDYVTLRPKNLVTGKCLRTSSGDRVSRFPEVKRSLSDRFPPAPDGGSKRSSRGLLRSSIRKTWSTGNFSAGGGGGSGARSAPATPLQLDAHPHHHHQHQATNKHDKHALKPVSGSAPSVRGGEGGAAGADGKQPSKARQKKFQRHFPQVGPEEKVLNYYSCALVGDLLLQGHLYITKNYFAFYSNVFGYVTKLLIPTTSVLRITKEKVARIIPNAVGVCTRDERHVFGSLLSRDATYKLMTHVWKASRVPELAAPKADLRTSEVELDASEYSLEDDSSSGGGDQVDSSPPIITRESEAIITTSGGAAIIQPALLTGSGPPPPRSGPLVLLLWLVAALLACSAAAMAARLYLAAAQPQKDLQELSGEELYEELVRWRARLHGRAASELHAFLTTNLLLLTKVRQSLEALSGVILTDMGQSGHVNIDVPNDTGFS